MSRFSVSDCFGCHEVISLASVGPDEDDTIPYRVDLPPGHTILSQYADRVRIRCPEGVASWIRWTDDSPRELDWWRSQYQSKKKDLAAGPECGRTPPTTDELKYFEDNIRRLGGNPGDVQHETWIEYHDRLVKEYYDVDAEWALIKEICPELDRPEPAPELAHRPRQWHPFYGLSVVWLGMSFWDLVIGATNAAIILFVMALTMFVVAKRRS